HISPTYAWRRWAPRRHLARAHLTPRATLLARTQRGRARPGSPHRSAVRSPRTTTPPRRTAPASARSPPRPPPPAAPHTSPRPPSAPPPQRAPAPARAAPPPLRASSPPLPAPRRPPG